MLPQRTPYSEPLITPRMTYYTRVVDNLTGEQVMGWVSTARNKDIFYGNVDAEAGGESDYIIEYDIHNNETYAWDANGPTYTCMDAINCALYIEMTSECRNLCPFFYARCITLHPEAEWEAITAQHPKFTNIQGLCSPDFGVILGSGDHAIIQTKIRLKRGSSICLDQYGFMLRFSYQYKK